MNVLDTLRAALRRAQQKHPGLTPAAQEDALLEILAALGGERVVIPKTVQGRPGRPPIPLDVQERAYRDGMGNESTGAVTNRHGIGRTKLYELMKSGPKRPK